MKVRKVKLQNFSFQYVHVRWWLNELLLALIEGPTHSEWTTGAGWHVPVPWVPDYRRWWVYNGIPYQVKQRAGDLGITAENMEEKSQHTDFNEDTTNGSASVTCSNAQLWKLDSQKEWRNTSWHFWDERTDKDSAGFVDNKENQISGFLTKLE